MERDEQIEMLSCLPKIRIQGNVPLGFIRYILGTRWIGLEYLWIITDMYAGSHIDLSHGLNHHVIFISYMLCGRDKRT
jgi:hypothetical protein